MMVAAGPDGREEANLEGAWKKGWKYLLPRNAVTTYKFPERVTRKGLLGQP